MKFTVFGKLVLWALLVIAGRVVALPAAEADSPSQYQCVVIRPGDNLWSLAATPDGDSRVQMEIIAQVNKLASSQLVAGNYILIPKENASNRVHAPIDRCN